MAIYRIVKGNSFTLHILMEKSVIRKENCEVDDFDLRQVRNLAVYLNTPCCEEETIPYSISTEHNNELVVKFPSDLMVGMRYGVTVRGSYAGNDICSIEKNLFKIVARNGNGKAEYGIAEGEQGSLYNTKYWIELNTSEVLSYYGALPLMEAESVDKGKLAVVGGTLEGTELTLQTDAVNDVIWLASPIKLTFSQGTLPLGMEESVVDGLYLYRTDELQPGSHTITIKS